MPSPKLLAALLLLASTAAPAQTQPLDHNWTLQSGCTLQASGDQISTPTYHPESTIPAQVPGTVLGAQVAAGLFPDPFFGANLRSIPGTDYPLTKIFGYLPMSPTSPYRCPWWYRTEFTLPPSPGSPLPSSPASTRPPASAQTVWLHFDGINYRANIWLNGHQLATSDQTAGAFRSYDFNITKQASAHNVLAVQVFAQTENDLGLDFLDWNPAPADKSLGLWRGVSLATSGPVRVTNPAAATHFLSDDLTQAELTITADATNSEDHPITASFTATVGAALGVAGGPQHVETTATLAPGETKPIHFPPLHLDHPQPWWPYQYGSPHLEHLEVSAAVDHAPSSKAVTNFGIREITAALNSDGHLQFQINRKNILIRGGGWNPDMFYREPFERLRQELTYVRQMHLNTIRLEGKLGSDDLFTLADQMGILVMAGWQCCDYWQKWDKWTPQDHAIAEASTYSQISRLRAHPSLLVWLNGSDEAPSPQAEQEALSILHERAWPNPILSTAADHTSQLTGPSGVKMTGPYDYVPPEYWYLDAGRASNSDPNHKADAYGGAFNHSGSAYGGAWGFNTETSPGPAIPTVASIERTLPKTSWWPIDAQWIYHAGLGKFAQYSTFTAAMDQTYGPAATLEDYDLKAQLMAYDGERAMFEAYGANKYRSTGVIQWMLNNAWPSFIWHLYDYYLVPGGGFFGAQKANEPLHIQYRYDDRSVALVNSTLTPYKNLQVTATLYDLQSHVLFHQTATADLPADGVARTLTIPAQPSTVFLQLELRDPAGKLVSQNFYWLPAHLAELDWSKTTYVTTPALHYADMRDLATLPQAQVEAKVQAGFVISERPSYLPVPQSGIHPSTLTIRLHNPGPTIAFFLYLRAVHATTGQDITPIDWSDNFLTLTPGETRVLNVSGLPTTPTKIELQGWNTPKQTLSPVQ